MIEPFIAYTLKGHVKVEILKNMGSGFYKCCKVYNNPKRRKRDIHILALVDINHKPINPTHLDYLPKWELAES